MFREGEYGVEWVDADKLPLVERDHQDESATPLQRARSLFRGTITELFGEGAVRHLDDDAIAVTVAVIADQIRQAADEARGS